MNYDKPDIKNVTTTQIKYVGNAMVYKGKASFSSDGDSEIINVNYSETVPVPPHKDLANLFLRLKPKLMADHGISGAINIIKGKDFNATEKQKKIIEDFESSNQFDTVVTGVLISGHGTEDKAIKITGTYDGLSINTRKIKFESEIGFNDELKEIVTAIEEEAYKFRFEGKRGKMEAV